MTIPYAIQDTREREDGSLSYFYVDMEYAFPYIPHIN